MASTDSCASSCDFSVGQEFTSFLELSSALKLWEERTCVTLYTRSSRTIAATRKRAPKRHMNDNLEFSELNYACVHGGREYVSKAKGKRKHQRYATISEYRYNM